jgi:hypothetical protein
MTKCHSHNVIIGHQSSVNYLPLLDLNLTGTLDSLKLQDLHSLSGFMILCGVMALE